MKSLAQLLPYFRVHRLRLAAGLFYILAASLIGLAAPVVIGRAVDAFQASTSARTLLGFSATLLALTLVQGIFNFAQRYTLVSMSRDIEMEIRHRFFAHLELQPQSFYRNNRTGDLMARSTNDLQAVRMVCGPAIMYSANTVFTGIGALVLMLGIHGRLTLLALCTMPLVVVVTKFVGERVHSHFVRVQERFADLSTQVQENLSGIRVVRAYVQEEAEARRFALVNESYVKESRGLIRWSSAFQPALQLLVGVGFVAVLWYGGRQVSSGAISLGEFVSFNFFLSKLIWPMIAIGWVTNLVQRGSVSLGRILAILETPPEIRDPELPVERDKLMGEVSFRDATFAYAADERPALRNINLEVGAGRTVAIVGRTGSGKSTLLSLIPRLIDAAPHSVFVDGTDVRDFRLGTLRGAIGFVPQESFLFSATLAENVAMGRPEASEEEVAEAARLAGLESDIASFPSGLATLVGERGVTLSGGQRQRVALARALLRSPRILLLDDALSAVDTRTEELILGNLRKVFEDRTVILVSHRVSAVETADEIVVLDMGAVVERGSHAELIAAGGRYADLYRRQRLEEELAAV